MLVEYKGDIDPRRAAALVEEYIKLADRASPDAKAIFGDIAALWMHAKGAAQSETLEDLISRLALTAVDVLTEIRALAGEISQAPWSPPTPHRPRAANGSLP